MTYKNLSETYRELKTILQPYTLRSSQGEGRIELQGGGLIEFWSLQTTSADTVRGRKYDGVIIDEAAYIPNGNYAWVEVIRPTISDKQGVALISSTTAGRNHFWEWYMKGVSGEQGWHSWTFPTNTNPFFPPEEFEALRHETPDMQFRQVYLAEFLEGEGAVFRRIGENAILEPQEPIVGHHYVMGIDWAMKNDFTVLTVMDRDTREMVAIDRFNQVNWSLQRGHVMTLFNQYKPEAVYAESNSIGSPNIEALEMEGLPMYAFETTGSSKPLLIESLVLAFERDEIKVLNDPILIGELMSYERKVSPTTGRSQYSAPDGMHDDCVISLALALWAITSPQHLYIDQSPDVLRTYRG